MDEAAREAVFLGLAALLILSGFALLWRSPQAANDGRFSIAWAGLRLDVRRFGPGLILATLGVLLLLGGKTVPPVIPPPPKGEIVCSMKDMLTVKSFIEFLKKPQPDDMAHAAAYALLIEVTQISPSCVSDVSKAAQIAQFMR